MKQLLTGTIASRMLIAFLSFALLIMTTNFLGKEGQGHAAMLVLNITMIIMFSEFLGGAALVYLVPRNPLNALLFPAYLWAILSGFLIYGSITLLGLSGIAGVHLLPLGIAQSFINCHIHTLVGLGKIKNNNLLSIFQIAVLAILFGLVPIIKDNVSFGDYLYATYFSLFSTLILSFFMVFSGFKLPTISAVINTVKSSFHYGFLVQTGNIAQLLNYRFSFYLLEYFHGISQVGIFSPALKIAEGVWIISKSLSLVQYSAISNNSDENFRKGLTMKLLRSSILLSSIFTLPFFFLPEMFYELIFGDEFGILRMYVPLLAPAILIFALSAIFSGYFAGCGQHKVNTYSSLIGLSITLICGFSTIPIGSVWGAILTATLSYLTATIFQAYIFFKETKIPLMELLPRKNDLIYWIKKES